MKEPDRQESEGPEEWRLAASSLRRSFAQRLVYRLWRRWERFNTGVILGLEPVVTSRPSIFRVRRTLYRGRPVRLDDGRLLSPGDPVVDLHFVTDALLGALARARSPVQMAVHLTRQVEDSLRVLAEFVAREQRYQDTVALYGITLMHRGARPLGFTVWELPPGFRRSFLTTYLRAFLSTMHPDALERTHRRRDKLQVRNVAMGRERLMERYGPTPGRAPALQPPGGFRAQAGPADAAAPGTPAAGRDAQG